MRRVILFVLSVGLLVSGLSLLAICLSHPTVYSLIRGAFMGVTFTGIGGFLLWDDFLRPLLRP